MAAFQRLFRATVVPSAALGGALYATAVVAAADEGVYPGRSVTGEKVRLGKDGPSSGHAAVLAVEALRRRARLASPSLKESGLRVPCRRSLGISASRSQLTASSNSALTRSSPSTRRRPTRHLSPSLLPPTRWSLTLRPRARLPLRRLPARGVSSRTVFRTGLDSSGVSSVSFRRSLRLFLGEWTGGNQSPGSERVININLPRKAPSQSQCHLP